MEYQKREIARRSTKTIEATIANGQTTSPTIDLNGFTFVGLIIPTIDAGNITFQVSNAEDGTFVALYDTTPAAITIAAGVGNFAVSDGVLGNALAPWQYLRIVAAVPQTAARTFILVVKP